MRGHNELLLRLCLVKDYEVDGVGWFLPSYRKTFFRVLFVETFVITPKVVLVSDVLLPLGDGVGRGSCVILEHKTVTCGL